MAMKKLLAILALTMIGAFVYAPCRAARASEAPVIKPEDNDEDIGREYLAGSFAARSNDYDEAARLFSEAVAKSPDNPFLLQNAYKASLLAGNYEAAADYARNYLRYDNKSTNALLFMAIYYTSRGDFPLASQMLDGIVPEKGKTVGFDQLIVPFIRTWIIAGSGNYDAALTSLDSKDVGNVVSKTFISWQKGLLYGISGNNDLAEQTFASLMGEKGIIPYHLTKTSASFYESIGKWDEAEIIYYKYRATHPSVPHFEGVNERLRAKITDGFFVKSPKQAMAEVMKEGARLLFSSGVNAEGMVYLRMALMLAPQDEEANILLASNFDEHKEWHKAMAIYDSIPQKSDFYWGAQINKAEDLYILGNKKEAEKLLLEVAKNIPEKYIPLVTLADALRRDLDYKKAADVYTEVLKNIDTKNPVSWAIYFGRGMCLERSNKWNLAEADFLKALELAPDQPEVVNYLAYSWVDRGQNLDKAKDMLLQAVARRPTDPQILDSAGWALYKIKDYKNAVVFLERASELMPQDAVMNDHLGDVYWQIGRKYEAGYSWQRAITYGPAESSTKEQLEHKIEKGLD